jgi:DNA-binding NarL/FixJ family response regulator
MPGIDGLEATYSLKARFPDLTVLMLSVGNKEQEIAAGLASGAAQYIVKGGPAREIVDAIKRHGSAVS